MKKKILFTSFSGIPSNETGGGNKIINEILSKINLELYSPLFFSDHLAAPISVDNLKSKKILFKKKFGKYLYREVAAYKLFVQSKYYQKYYLNRINNRFGKISSGLNSYNIIHAHDTLSAVVLSKSTVSKKILSIHSKGSFYKDYLDRFESGEFLKNWVKKLRSFELQNFNNAHIVTFPSYAAKNIFLAEDEKNLNAEKTIKVIYNGINIKKILNLPFANSFKNQGIRKEKYDLILINVAVHTNTKNIEKIFPVLIKLKQYLNPLLLNIGTGYKTKSLIKISQKLNLKSNLLFCGNRKNDDVIRMMKESDVFIHLSENVIFDLVILEAIACGLPVIASNDGGNKEIIKDGVNGYLVDPNNLEQITQRILQMKELSRHKSITLDEKFSSENMVSEYQKLYEE